MAALLAIIGDFMPYMPTRKRKELIDAANVPPFMKQIMQRLADQAPDLPGTFIARYDAALKTLTDILGEMPPPLTSLGAPGEKK